MSLKKTGFRPENAVELAQFHFPGPEAVLSERHARYRFLGLAGSGLLGSRGEKRKYEGKEEGEWFHKIEVRAAA